MKLFAPLFCSPLLLVPVLYGQGVINTATISSTVTITNPAGAVKTRLLAAGGPQLRSHYVTAVSNEVSPRVATASQVPTSTTGSTLPLTVDAAGSPSYRVTQRVDFEVWFEQFYWPQSGLIPVVPAGTSATGVSGMVSIVDFQFGEAIAGGSIRAFPAGVPAETLAVVGSLPAGVTHCEFVVPVGVPLVLELGIDIGSGGRLSRALHVRDALVGARGGLYSRHLRFEHSLLAFAFLLRGERTLQEFRCRLRGEHRLLRHRGRRAHLGVTQVRDRF